MGSIDLSALAVTPAAVRKKAGLFYSVELYGAVGDGSTDDSAAIQAAIDAAYNAGGGTVLIGQDVYRAINLKLKRNVTLQGTGWGSTLQAPSTATSADAVVRTTEHATQATAYDELPHHAAIRSLRIDGNARAGAACDGIRFVSRDASGDLEPGNDTGPGWGSAFVSVEDWNDPAPVIDSVMVMDAGRHGFLIGHNMRGIRFVNCFAYACRQIGFYVIATDYWLTQCDAGSCGDGFVVKAGEGRLVGCKAWYSRGSTGVTSGWFDAGTAFSGGGIGFTVLGSVISQQKAGLSLIGCTSQDNYTLGYYLYGARVCQLIGCRSGGDVTAAIKVESVSGSPAAKNSIDLTLTWGDRPAGDPAGSAAGTLGGVLLAGSATIDNDICLVDDAEFSHATGYVPIASSGGAVIAANRFTTRRHTDIGIGMTVDPVGAHVNTGYAARVRVGTVWASKVRMYVGTAAGNINVAVYAPAADGSPGAKKGETGTIACPAAGVRDVSLTASCLVEVGDYIVVGFDNAAARLIGVIPFNAASSIFDGICGFFTITGLTMPSTAPTMTGYGIAHSFRAIA